MIIRPASPETGTTCDFGPLRALIRLKHSLQKHSLQSFATNIESTTLAEIQQIVQNTLAFHEIFTTFSDSHDYAKLTSAGLTQLPNFLK